MKVYLYENSSDTHVIGKQLKNKTKFEGDGVRFLHPTSLENPTIEIYLADGAEVSDYTIYNYMYIPQFDRYYYISNMTFKTAKIVNITGEVDALESFKSDLLDADNIQYINRTSVSGLWNKYIPDSNFKLSSIDWIQYKNFGIDLITPTGDYILTTISGV